MYRKLGGIFNNTQRKVAGFLQTTELSKGPSNLGMNNELKA